VLKNLTETLATSTTTSAPTTPECLTNDFVMNAIKKAAGAAASNASFSLLNFLSDSSQHVIDFIYVDCFLLFI